MITPKRLKELERAEAKLQALEAGGVDNWEFYDVSLEDYRKTTERDERIEELVENIAETLCMEIDQPAGVGCGYSFTIAGLERVEQLIRDYDRRTA